MTSPTRRLYRNPIFDSSRWDSFQPRPDDILIVSAPKSGTTWMQRIVSCLVFGGTELPGELDRISPWLDYQVRNADLDSLMGRLEAQRHRRFIKTHLPADGLPEMPGTVRYINVWRDLRDAIFSFYNQLSHSRQVIPGVPETERDFWKLFFSGGSVAGGAVVPREVFFTNLTTWWEQRNDPRILVTHYQDLLDDLEGEMRRIAAHLDITVAEEKWPEIVAACRFDAMRADSKRLAPPVPSNDGEKWFFNRGTSGQWREKVAEEDVKLYEDVARTLPDDLRAWLEHAKPAT